MEFRLNTVHVSIRVSYAHTLVPYWVLRTTQLLAIVCVTLIKVHNGLKGLRNVVTILFCDAEGSCSENLAFLPRPICLPSFGNL